MGIRFREEVGGDMVPQRASEFTPKAVIVVDHPLFGEFVVDVT
jgi:hypothetical protein